MARIDCPPGFVWPGGARNYILVMMLALRIIWQIGKRSPKYDNGEGFLQISSDDSIWT